MGVRPRGLYESCPPEKREQNVFLHPTLSWCERSLARLSFPNPLETGAVRIDEETVLVLAAIGAPCGDCLRSLVHGFLDRAVAHFGIPGHIVLASRPCREQ